MPWPRGGERMENGNADEHYAAALKSATRMLARRQHGRRELETKLLARFGGEPVGRVIERLGELGYLNDKEFAREYARQRFCRSPRSSLSVIVELEGRGVDRALAGSAVAAVMEDEGLSDESLAERAARKKMAALGLRSTEKAGRKIYAFLASRGFPRSLARRTALDVLGTEMDGRGGA